MRLMRFLILCLLLFTANKALVAQVKLDSVLASLNKDEKKWTINNFKQVGELYFDEQNNAKALAYYEKALTQAKAEKISDEISLCYTKISSLQLQNFKTKEALISADNAIANLNTNQKTKLLAEAYLVKVAPYLIIGKADSSLYFLDKSTEINEHLKLYKGLFRNYTFYGLVFHINKNDKQKALKYYEKALGFAIKANDKANEAIANFNLAICESSLGNYTKAIEYDLESIKISENNTSLNKKSILNTLPTTYTHLASVYGKLNNLEKKATYLEKTKAIYASLNERGMKYTSLLEQLASLYDAKAEYEKALAYKQEMITIFESKGIQRAMSGAYNDIGESYLKIKNYERAFLEYNKGLANAYKYSDSAMISTSLMGIGEVYTHASDETLIKLKIPTTNRYQIANEKFFEAKRINGTNQDINMEAELWNDISTAYEKQNDFTNALSAYKNSIELKDKILNDKVKKDITRLEIKNEYTKKEDSIKLHQAFVENKLLQEQFVNKQQAQNISLQEKNILVGQQKLLLSQQQLSLSNKETELQHLAYLQSQAELQTGQLQKSEQEKLLTLVQKEKALQSAKVFSLSQENDLNKLKRRQQFTYGIIGLASLILGGLYFFKRSKHKQEQLKAALAKEKAEQLQKDAEFQRSIADVSMSALRSQMNPHFIFNCLNSIKLYTTQNNNEAAANYLTKFSKLIRMALENSRSETVTLHSEIEALELYIQMEAMRFKEKLKYSITVNKNVDSNFIEIPPLLIQPYVENAIWHGLMHKEDGGNIEVAISAHEDESLLYITVKDDGVGREKSALLRGKSASKHTSYGTKVTAERIELINKIYKTDTTVTTEDVKNENGEVAGTLVTIKIPFE